MVLKRPRAGYHRHMTVAGDHGPQTVYSKEKNSCQLKMQTHLQGVINLFTNSSETSLVFQAKGSIQVFCFRKSFAPESGGAVYIYLYCEYVR